jgi:hypothetical protein
MLKRLLIATLVVCLVFSLGSFAFAGNQNTLQDKGSSKSIHVWNPNNPKLDAVTRADEIPSPAERTDPSQEGLHSISGTVPARPSAPAPFCDALYYHGNSIALYWALPSAFWGSFGTRFTSAAGIACTVKTAWVLVYGDAQVGDPDLKVTLYDDNGFGQPGTALENVVVPNASLPQPGDGFAWVGVPFTGNHVIGKYISDQDYFVVCEVVQNSPDDTVAVLSGDGTTNPSDGEGRCGGYRFSAGEYKSFLAQYGDGNDIDLFYEVDRCCYDLPYSDCNIQAWHDDAYYIWATPHNVYGDSAWAVRFSPASPSTLKAVQVGIYDRTGSPNAGPNYIAGNDDLIIRVYDDTGGNYPGPLLHTETVPGGTYPFYPAMTVVPMSTTMVMDHDFWVAFSTSAIFGSGDYEVLQGDDGTFNGGLHGGSGRTVGSGDPTYAADCGDPVWYPMTCWWGGDFGFFIEAELCKDQYALCQNQDWSDGPTNVYTVPDLNYDIADYAQTFMASGADCRVDHLELNFYRHPADSIWPNMYTQNTVISIYQDVGGLPGATLWSTTLTPADYAANGYTGSNFYGWFTIDVYPNIAIGGTSFIVGTHADGPSPGDPLDFTGIRILMDNDGGLGNNGGAFFNYGGSWGYSWSSWADDAAMELTAKICCIPFNEQDCSLLPVDSNWANLSKDQTRSGRSPNALGDAWCDLNLVWDYESPTDRTWYTSSTIYDGKVACSFGDHYVVFDLATGTALYTLSGIPALDPTPEELGTTIRCAPFITPVSTLGGQVLMFVSGGTERSIIAYDFNTGVLVWSRAFSTVGLGGLYGDTRFCPFMYFEDLNGSGVDVLCWATDGGTVVAADASNGVLFRATNYPGFGWATDPVDITAGSEGTNKTGCTNGTSMFFGTDPGTIDGDVYSVDASTGLVNWTLSGTGGLQAAALWTAFGGIEAPVPDLEQFRSGISYENGTLYFASYLAQGEFPAEGAFYRVAAGTGALIGGSATLARPGTFLYGTPIIDINRIYMPGVSRWLSPPLDQLCAYDKSTGALAWRAEASPAGLVAGNRADGVLTCEPSGADDLLLLFSDDGFFRVVNSTNGDEIYHRRVHSPGGGSNDMGMGISFALNTDGVPWVVASDFYGNLMAMQKQVGNDRPRLEILSYRPQVSVEFGSNPSYQISLGQLLTNTGCADLTINDLVPDANPPADASEIPTFSAQVVDPNVAFRAASLADQLTNDGFKTVKSAKLQNTKDDAVPLNRGRDREITSTNKAAAAPPAWFVSITTDFGLPAVLAPGDTAQILVTADQVQITRGPLPLYITVDCDDPDFFLNTFTQPVNEPVIAATIVGGCLIDSTTLAFGAGGANTQLVPNTGRIGTGDWDPHGIEVDGEQNYIYQGTFIYAVSPRRIAVNTQAWHGGGEVESWISMQPDPNWCDDQCKAPISPASLGMYSTDGLSYAPVSGHIVCASYVDSVQNFDNGGDWDWTLYTTAPFDNDSTMGLYVNTRTAGADDGTPLTTNMTLEIMQFANRNNRDLPGWKFGAHVDEDINVDESNSDADTVWIDRSISTAWATGWPGTSHAFGWVKIPFGCVEGWDSNPIKNVVGLNADSCLFDDTIIYNRFYEYMSKPPGATYGQNMTTAAQDDEFLTTIKEHDFTPYDTIEFAVAMFAYGNLTNSHSSAELVDQSLFANKWAGFGRGDLNNDNAVNLADIMYLAYYLADVNNNPGPVPFLHLGDVNADGNIDQLDLDYLMAYYFDCGPCPTGAWTF